MPKAYIYTRVSTLDQATSAADDVDRAEARRKVAAGEAAASSWSLDAQQERARACFKVEFEPKGFELYPSVLQDAAVTSKKPMLNRPAGFLLNGLLADGDVVIIPKIDRAFRSVRDLVTTVELWERRGVALRLLDLNYDTSSAVGRLMLHIMGAFAEFERNRISERTKEALAQRIKTKGHWGSKQAPLGYRWVNGAKPRRLAPRADETTYMLLVWKMKHEEGLFRDEIIARMRKLNMRNLRSGNEADHNYVWRLLRAEQRRRERAAAAPVTSSPSPPPEPRAASGGPA